ncbi:restriction endonuclease subunit S [Priestia megaterium]|nr:restriction endonuclease subunit S [Priestia megaterium]
MNVPTLRFKEFEGEWINQKLKAVAEVYDGTHQTPKYKQHGVKFLSVENIKDLKTKKFISEEDFEKEFKIRPEYNDILMTRIGDIGTPNIIRDYEKYAYYVSLALIKVHEVNSEYLFHFIGSEKFQKQLHKRTLHVAFPKKINMGEIGECYISLPLNEGEQKKIASFFNVLNEKVQLQQEKIDLLQEQKKSYMQKIFKQEIRFKDNDKEFPKWRNLQLKNCVFPLKGNSFNNEIDLTVPVLTISAKRGFINQKERFSEVIAGNSLKKYTEVHKQDLSYNKGNSKTAKYGCVFIQKDYETALVPNVYKSFRANNQVEPLFLEYLFATKLIDRQLRQIITSTARMDGLLNVSDEDFYNMTIDLPILEEQKKITNFLYKLDEKIQIEQQKLEALQKEKKGFIKKMFI